MVVHAQVFSGSMLCWKGRHVRASRTRWQIRRIFTEAAPTFNSAFRHTRGGHVIAEELLDETT